MKIAISLRGQPRDYLRGYEFLNNEIISKYDVDVFGHAWWDKDSISEKYDSNPHSLDLNYRIEEDIPDKLKYLYNFKKLNIEKPRKFTPLRKYNNEQFYNSLNSQYYSLKKGLEDVEEYELANNIQYDFIIITRWDIYSSNPFINLNELDNTKIYVAGVHIDSNVFYDPLIICSGKHKWIFKTLFDDFDKAYDALQSDYRGVEIGKELRGFRDINGEQIMSVHLLLNNMSSNLFKVPALNDFLIELMKKRKMI
jgi:hypothetical protein